MLIAGISVRRSAVEALVALLQREYYVQAATTLARALEDDAAAVGLTIRERTAVLDVLDDPPAGLEQLRGVLLAEHTWRRAAHLSVNV